MMRAPSAVGMAPEVRDRADATFGVRRDDDSVERSALELRVRQVASAGALLCGALGLLALFGWIFGIGWLTSFVPDAVATQPSAALAMMVIGGAVLAYPSHRRWLGRLRGWGAGFVLLLGIVTLLQYVLGVSSSVDQALFGTRRAGDPAGRMAATTAVCLLASGIVVLLDRRQDRIRRVLGGLVLALGATVAVEHVLGVDFIDSQLWSSTAMALPSAIGFVGLGLALVLQADEGGFVSLLTADTAGGYMARRFGPACLLVPLVVGALARVGYTMGLYSAYERLVVIVIGSAFVFYGLVAWSARRLHLIDLQRLQGRRDLQGRESDLAEALERERSLRSQADEAARLNRMLRRLANSFARELDERALVQQVTDEATRVTGADYGAFVFGVQEGQSFTLYSSGAGQSAPASGFPPARDSKLWHATFAEQVVVRLDDVRDDSRVESPSSHNASLSVLASYLAIPVKTRAGEVLGGLFFGHREPGRFTLDHEVLVSELAGQACIALENARLYRALRESEARARAADRRKDEFLAMLGHELRNPLAPITTALRLVQDQGDTAKAWNVIQRQVGHLKRLVEDLMDISRVTRGNIELSLAPTDLPTVVRDAIDMVAPVIEGKRHHLEVDLDPQAVVNGDEHRLCQIFSNLIENAAKYTEPGGHIRVRAAVEDGEVVVQVIDDGRGIPPESIPELFDAFVQGPRTLDRSEGGLGIGLAVVRSMVELHGGRISARSPGLGQGSTFEVRLPLAAAEEAGAQRMADTPAAEPDRSREASRAVLVVDDNEDAADMLALLLQSWGFDTRVAHGGHEALDELEQGARPELAVLDIGLPVMDGYELAEQIRRRYGHDIKLVALTGYGQPRDKERAMQAGFDEHLVKPVDAHKLRSSVRGLLEQQPPPRN